MRQRNLFLQMVVILIAIFLNVAALQAGDSRKVDINTASIEELIQLKGIGPKKAAMIINFRETNGPFQMPEDIINVPGIGPKTFEANKERIEVKAD